MKNLLTISEYSKIRGCSVSAVYKRLKSPSNNIHNYVVVEEGQTYLKEEILDYEGLRKEDPTPSSTTTQPVEEERKSGGDVIGALAISALESQLKKKDEQIEELNKRLAEAIQHEREMSDRLADLLAQSNELQRNNQILLAQAQQKQLEGTVEEEPEVKEEPKAKRPWYKKLFGV